MREKNLKNCVRVPHISMGLFLLVVAAIIFGCSSSENKSTKTAASNPKGKLDSCALLSAEVAAEVLGD